MRLPLRHAPPVDDAPLRGCAHLEALLRAARGLPLGPAASALSTARSRGRHGNALQWHLGLAAHDAQAILDWEDRIEIKLVSVWRRAGAVVCDKLKVCDIAVDPWAKLGNVAFVFADRTTRVVVGHAMFRLAGAARLGLGAAWDLDPHFDRPALFVEAREGEGGAAPAYYLAASWFTQSGLLAGLDRGVFGVPAGIGSAPRVTAVVAGGDGRGSCPRCGAPLRHDPQVVVAEGIARAHHGLPLPASCAPGEHVVVDRARLPIPTATSVEDAIAGLEGRWPQGLPWRLVDRVAEPDDHRHG